MNDNTKKKQYKYHKWNDITNHTLHINYTAKANYEITDLIFLLSL